VRQSADPIIVTSPIVKLLEARLKAKVDDYMMTVLHRSQVGFVPTMVLL